MGHQEIQIKTPLPLQQFQQPHHHLLGCSSKVLPYHEPDNHCQIDSVSTEQRCEAAESLPWLQTLLMYSQH
nr:hypothetical protein Iba_chr14aCG27370 [Ipomoea batatas]GMD90471.1 hypothetical protein Iba_chr14dCG9980 [Ipomoea batatas]